jgi:L-lactate dehydrogenase complex protein LldG
MKSARQEILDKLRKTKLAVPDSPDTDAPVYFPVEKPFEVAFKNNLEKVNGSVYICNSEKELFEKLQILISKNNQENTCCREINIQQKLHKYNIKFSECVELPEEIEVGITGCEFLVAHTGSVMVSSAQQGNRQMFVYPPIHIVIAERSQIVDYLENAYLQIQNKYKKNLPSQITIVTGPSRTADIEKTLILGAHGPKELHVFLY